MHFPSSLLDDEHFMRESTAFTNTADEGIAYLVMQDGERQREIRDAMGKLAEYVASQVGLPRPQANIGAKRSAEGAK